MAFKYVLMPVLAWLAAGSLKFFVNFIRFGRQAFTLIGYGGFPSTHTTIMSSTVWLIGWEQGWESPLFGLGLTVLFIIVIDAMGLRRTIGRHAAYINRHLTEQAATAKPLRERQGHSPLEIGGGLLLGAALAALLHFAGH